MAIKPGRQISPKDKDIFKELSKHYPKDRVKLDLDIMSEPCIYYRFHAAWEPVYKLSSDGNYIRNRWYYVVQATNAIQAHLRDKWELERKHKLNGRKELEDYDNTKKVQRQFQKRGLKGDFDGPQEALDPYNL